ncbi:MAG: hypothetical protein A3G73_10695 [Rhodospirillales bacterium RIFCSPLOWO2_12_FULL_67_15]|nr:MAG: hypothetical protein A3G73_10695 [Rhodospirillales bacterium RIFCSPLOWO2_12_FULL_67_15]
MKSRPSTAHEAICSGTGRAHPPSISANAKIRILLDILSPWDYPHAGRASDSAEHGLMFF